MIGALALFRHEPREDHDRNRRRTASETKSSIARPCTAAIGTSVRRRLHRAMRGAPSIAPAMLAVVPTVPRSLILERSTPSDFNSGDDIANIIASPAR